jgi:hypothetical protein
MASRFELLIFICILPEIAYAGGGGGALVLLIAVPVVLWVSVKILSRVFRAIGQIFEGDPEKIKHDAPQRITDARDEVECPSCAELILRKASKCKHCGSEIKK